MLRWVSRGLSTARCWSGGWRTPATAGPRLYSGQGVSCWQRYVWYCCDITIDLCVSSSVTLIKLEAIKVQSYYFIGINKQKLCSDFKLLLDAFIDLWILTNNIQAQSCCNDNFLLYRMHVMITSSHNYWVLVMTSGWCWVMPLHSAL